MTIHTHTFHNGFRLIYEKPSSSTSSISSIQVFCKVGSAMEKNEIRGGSHLVEHMVFKGTRKMPQSIEIAETYNKIGSYFNATTEKSYTNYIVKCENESVKKCIEVLGDMMLNSVFDKDEFEKEKKVITEETILIADSGDNIINDLYDANMYKGSPYEHSVDELSYHVSESLKYENVYQYYKTYYVPNNMVLSIISNLSFQTFLEIVIYSDFVKTVSSSRMIFCPSKCLSYDQQTEPQYILKTHKGLHTMYLTIGFKTCSQYSKDKYALNLLSNILGGYNNARLFHTLRGENGLTYSSNATTIYYNSLGDFSITAKTDPSKLFVNRTLDKKLHKGVLPLIVDIIVDLQKRGVTTSELHMAKTNLKGTMSLEEENTQNACFYNGSKLLLYDEIKGEPLVSYEDRYEKYYQPITQQDINHVIKKYFMKKNMTLCVLSNKRPHIKTIKDICNKIR